MLIIGAGPAGSAAAISLARRGVDVLLVDMKQFPRDKICGDALIPDALAALEALGVRDTVCASGRTLKGVKIYAPDGRAVVLNGDCAVVPRGVFDDILRAAAVESGARFMAPYRVVEPIGADLRVEGATFRHATDGHRLDVDARWTILASGAAGEVLRTFRVAQRVEASATAGRLYMRVPQSVALELPHLLISFDRQITPGYGWVFPGPGNVLNVGVGVFHDRRRTRRFNNLRLLMNRFLNTFPPARLAASEAVERSPFIGARLRTGLTGCVVSRAGLLVAGEALGATYSFSGEGIGKALQTGMLAATTAYEALDSSADPVDVATTYAHHLEATFRDRFRAYKLAQDCLEYPPIGNFLAWRASAGSFARSQLEGWFNETTDPKQLFSAWGLFRATFS